MDKKLCLFSFFSVLTNFLLDSRLISARGLPQTDDCSFCDV